MCLYVSHSSFKINFAPKFDEFLLISQSLKMSHFIRAQSEKVTHELRTIIEHALKVLRGKYLDRWFGR